MNKRIYLFVVFLSSLYAGNCVSSHKEILYIELMQKKARKKTAATNSEKTKRVSGSSWQISQDTIDRLLELTKYDNQ